MWSCAFHACDIQIHPALYRPVSNKTSRRPLTHGEVQRVQNGHVRYDCVHHYASKQVGQHDQHREHQQSPPGQRLERFEDRIVLGGTVERPVAIAALLHQMGGLRASGTAREQGLGCVKYRVNFFAHLTGFVLTGHGRRSSMR